jgi:hypothetical protein
VQDYEWLAPKKMGEKHQIISQTLSSSDAKLQALEQ